MVTQSRLLIELLNADHEWATDNLIQSMWLGDHGLLISALWLGVVIVMLGEDYRP